jgi:alpha-beta hydrolase superfamily lysophospholipase
VAVLIHGFGEHLLRYDEVAEVLVEGGYLVVAVDVRGHGKSDGRRGHVMAFGEFNADVDAAFDVADRVHPGGDRLLVGHSHGGLLALQYVIEGSGRSPVALVVTSPFLGIAVKVPGWKAAAGRLLSRLKPDFLLPTDLDASLLSCDADVVEAYTADPLVHDKASARWFTEVQKAHAEVLRRAGEVVLPTLVMQGGDDKIVDVEATRRVAEALGAEDKKYIEYAGLRHEIFNEVERARVYDDLRSWLTERDLWTVVD